MSSYRPVTGFPVVPITIDEDDLYSGVLKLLETLKPTWPANKVQFKMLTNGITNKLVSCSHIDLKSAKDVVLVRIYGKKTDLFIDRTAEIRNMKILNAIGHAPTIYGVFDNGLAYEFYPGVTLDINSVKEDKIWPLVAKELAEMHRVELGEEIPKEPCIWPKIENFLELIPEPFSTEDKQNRFTNLCRSKTKLRLEYKRLKSYLSKIKSPIVFAHNDLLLLNVIYDDNEMKIHFIDYEYAGYNYQAFDIANHFNEFVGLEVEDMDYSRYPKKKFQLKWIRVYLKEYLGVEPTDAEVNKVYEEVQQVALLSHFLWGLWAIMQFEHSDIDFDYARYAEIRLNMYYELKNDIFRQLS